MPIQCAKWRSRITHCGNPFGLPGSRPTLPIDPRIDRRFISTFYQTNNYFLSRRSVSMRLGTWQKLDKKVSFSCKNMRVVAHQAFWVGWPANQATERERA
jgi:hypothetical protein